MKVHYDAGSKDLCDENGKVLAQFIHRKDGKKFRRAINCHDSLVTLLTQAEWMDGSQHNGNQLQPADWAELDRLCRDARQALSSNPVDE